MSWELGWSLQPLSFTGFSHTSVRRRINLYHYRISHAPALYESAVKYFLLPVWKKTSDLLFPFIGYKMLLTVVNTTFFFDVNIWKYWIFNCHTLLVFLFLYSSYCDWFYLGGVIMYIMSWDSTNMIGINTSLYTRYGAFTKISLFITQLYKFID